jgi:hypothetical protein
MIWAQSPTEECLELAWQGSGLLRGFFFNHRNEETERRAEVLAWVKREEKAGRERRRQGSRGQGQRM